jgi:hypothetical protein
MRVISLFPQNLGVQRRPSGYKPGRMQEESLQFGWKEI